jgi:hypothetical protein
MVAMSGLRQKLIEEIALPRCRIGTIRSPCLKADLPLNRSVDTFDGKTFADLEMMGIRTNILAWRPRLGLISAAVMLVAALCVRVGVVLTHPDFAFPDEKLYFDIARHVADENRYQLSPGSPFHAIRQAPGLPLTLGVLGKVAHLTPSRAKLLNGLVSVLMSMAYAGAVWRLTRNLLAVNAVILLTAFHPTVLYTSVTNYPQTFQGLWLALLTLTLAGVVIRPNAGPARPGLISGLLIGIGALYVPTEVFVVPAVVAFFWRRGWRWLAGFVLFLGIGLAVAVTPWTLRNLIMEKEFIVFSTCGGEQFYWGFNEQAGMNTDSRMKIPPAMEKEVFAARSGRESERIFLTHATSWVRENKAQAVRLWALKFLNYFRWDNGEMTTKSEYSRSREWIARLTTLVVFGLALWGSWRLWTTERAWTVLTIVLFVCLAAGHAFFTACYRYRLPYEPFLLFMGTIGCFRLRETTATVDESGHDGEGQRTI